MTTGCGIHARQSSLISISLSAPAATIVETYNEDTAPAFPCVVASRPHTGCNVSVSCSRILL